MSTSIDSPRGKSKRGGARPGAGRPPKDPADRRAKLTARVSPHNMSRLQAYAERTGKSLSEALDAMLTAHETEARYQALVKSTGQIVWTIAPDERVTMSEAWTALTGQPAVEAGGRGWRAHIHPDDRERLDEQRRQAHATQRPVTFECRVLRHDGAFRRVRSSAVPVFEPDGALREWVGASEDVEDALVAHEDCERMLTRAPWPMAVTGLDGAVLRANAACEELLGRSFGELQRRPLAALVHPDDKAIAAESLERLFQEGHARATCRVLRPDGHAVAVDWRLTLEGGRIYATGVGGDQAAERDEAIARAAARLDSGPWTSPHALLQQAESLAGLGSFELSRDRGEVQWSEGHYRLFGRPALHKTLSFEAAKVWIHPDDLEAVSATFREGLRSGGAIEVDYRVIRPDGTQRHLRSRCRPLVGEPDRYVGVTRDMTRWLDSTRALARSEREHREIFDHVSVGLLFSDAAGRFLRVNDAAARMLGYAPEELTALSFLDISHPDDVAMSLSASDAIATGTDEVRLEKRYVRRDGSVVTGDLTVRWVPPDGDMPGYRIATLRDVTDQRRAEEELRLAEHRFRSVFEAAPACIALGDPQGRIVQANRAFAELVGYEVEELLRMVFTQYTHPDDVGDEWTAFKRLVAGETEGATLEKRYLTKDGRVVSAAVELRLVRHPDGSPAFVVAIAHDVTEQRRAMAALVGSRQLLAETISLARVGAWAWHIDDDRLEWSDEQSRLWGLNPGEAPATMEALQLRVHPDDREALRRRLAAALSGEPPEAVDLRTVGPAPRVFHTTARAERGADGRVKRLYGTTQDITDRRRAEAATADALAELEAANARLRESEGYKDEFLSVVNHELRTPLNFIMGFASVLDDGVAGPLNEAQRQHVKRIEQGADRLLGMVDDMLLVAQVNAGMLRLDRQPVGYASLVREVVADVAARATARGVTVECDVPAAARADLDALRLKRVLEALLDNAVKFSPKGGLVRVRARLTEDGWLTEVQDGGPGIPHAAQPRIFERFEQLDMSRTRPLGGAGLGLAIARAFVEAHGGVLGLDSEPGRGSTFWFTLPPSDRSPC